MQTGSIGAFMLADEPITLNKGKAAIEIMVRNSGPRVIQIGSHFHFFEVNRDLLFDRKAAFGFHLDIPSGTSIRWLPGEEKPVRLTEYGGTQELFGFNELTNGCVRDPKVREKAFERARARGFLKESGGVST